MIAKIGRIRPSISIRSVSASPNRAKGLGRANGRFFLEPVIAACPAYLILGQTTPIQLLAILVICGCVLVEVFWDQIAGRFAGAAAQGDV